MTTLIIQPFLSLNGKVFHYRIYVQDGFDVSDRYRWRGQLKASALEGGFCKGLPSSAPGAVFNYDPTREGRKGLWYDITDTAWRGGCGMRLKAMVCALLLGLGDDYPWICFGELAARDR